MSLHRRELLAGLGGLAASAAFTKLPAMAAWTPGRTNATTPGFPGPGDFAIPEGVTYMNNAVSHPMPKKTIDAVQEYLHGRYMAVGEEANLNTAKAAYARLINATPDEVSLVPNTSSGENHVVNGLGIPERSRSGINVVTDAFQFEGALIHLQALQRYHGLDLRIVRPRGPHIDMRDIERVVDDKTALISVSLVSRATGFQHDLKKLSDLAHAHGAYVYADVIQAAGNVPIDVRASNVDFLSGAGYKWLMSDSPGFMYIRKDLIGTAVKRYQWAHYSSRGFRVHYREYDAPAPAGQEVISWQPGDTAGSYFELGSRPNSAVAALGSSIQYILDLGVDRIQAHRAPLMKKLRDEMPRLGFRLESPPESTSAIIVFSKANAEGIDVKLRNAKVHITGGGGRGTWGNYLRIAPSIFNDIHDVDRLLEALS